MNIFPGKMKSSPVIIQFWKNLTFNRLSKLRMTVKLRNDQKIKVNSAKSLYPIMQQILLREKHIDRQKEHGWVAALSKEYKLLSIELISLGNGNLVYMDATDIFSFPLQKKSNNIMLIHNHPGGSLKPSLEDKDFTARIMSVGELINVKVLDHIIITENGYYSFEETGLMDLLEDGVSIKIKAAGLAEDKYKINMRNLKNEVARLKSKLKEATKGIKPPAKKAAPKKKGK